MRVAGSELIQKYLGDAPKLLRELFKTAHDMKLMLLVLRGKLDDSASSGEREVQQSVTNVPFLNCRTFSFVYHCTTVFDVSGHVKDS